MFYPMMAFGEVTLAQTPESLVLEYWSTLPPMKGQVRVLQADPSQDYGATLTSITADIKAHWPFIFAWKQRLELLIEND